MFFGACSEFPEGLISERVTLSFIARPLDFADQKEAVAAALRVLPTYDPVFLTPEAQADPDSVLEALPELWHTDRTSSWFRPRTFSRERMGWMNSSKAKCHMTASKFISAGSGARYRIDWTRQLDTEQFGWRQSRQLQFHDVCGQVATRQLAEDQ
jgi:hypothetical protein